MQNPSKIGREYCVYADSKPKILQLLLTMDADTNEPNVVDNAKKDAMMDAIRIEAFRMSQDKEKARYA